MWTKRIMVRDNVSVAHRASVRLATTVKTMTWMERWTRIVNILSTFTQEIKLLTT